jgi:hypothetical protein
MIWVRREINQIGSFCTTKSSLVKIAHHQPSVGINSVYNNVAKLAMAAVTILARFSAADKFYPFRKMKCCCSCFIQPMFLHATSVIDQLFQPRHVPPKDQKIPNAWRRSLPQAWSSRRRTATSAAQGTRSRPPPGRFDRASDPASRISTWPPIP